MHEDEKIRQIDANFAQRDGIKIWLQFSSLGKKLMPNFDAIPLSKIPPISSKKSA